VSRILESIDDSDWLTARQKNLRVGDNVFSIWRESHVKDFDCRESEVCLTRCIFILALLDRGDGI
jgi:hypothetical protein